MPRYVMINADDFGLSCSINRGVMEAHRLGTVSSASLMVNTPGFLDAVSLARAAPSLGVGLHFNLTYGIPATNPLLVPSLVRDEGSFHGNLAEWNPHDIALELENQYRRMLEHGIRPTHVDSHQHIHLESPDVYNIVKKLVLREQLPVRLPSSRPDPELPWIADELLMYTYDRQTGVPHLLSLLRNIPEGITELLCHPGYVDDDVRRLSAWTTAREEELTVFTDPQVIACIADLQARGLLQVIHYGQFPAIRSILNNEKDASRLRTTADSASQLHAAADTPSAPTSEPSRSPMPDAVIHPLQKRCRSIWARQNRVKRKQMKKRRTYKKLLGTARSRVRRRVRGKRMGNRRRWSLS
ncbi:carbohydrate deacetylase [Paenibacillus dendritiformis]|uniref:carbohydrate deacetylase n=1 Tax=Paenibacillus dendritiformis TaxID=130049 RepID=UPI001BD0AF39|nr:ChbG/HpnK family deacetylase [Paenibacillus dendritiformis]